MHGERLRESASFIFSYRDARLLCAAAVSKSGSWSSNVVGPNGPSSL